jgi:hypothetical protein
MAGMPRHRGPSRWSPSEPRCVLPPSQTRHGRAEACPLVETIATACGFGSAVSVRQHFRRILGTTPMACRRAFAAAR